MKDADLIINPGFYFNHPGTKRMLLNADIVIIFKYKVLRDGLEKHEGLHVQFFCILIFV